MKKRGKSFWNPIRVAICVVLLFVAVGVALWAYLQGKNVAVLDPQGVVAAHEKSLMIFTLLLSLVVVVPVFTMLFTIAWRYREGNPKKVKYTPDVDGSRWMETLWWGVPIVIIGILCVVTWVSTHQLDPYRALDSKVKPFRVQVVALQWKWLFIYPDYHVASLNQLKIPAKTPVNFEITADGPMSAFWVPNLGTQTYAMTGMSAQLSLMADHAGTYRGSNSNISGTGYADMTFDVQALPTRQAFYEWAKSIANDQCREHLAWDEYEQLAKPSIVNHAVYYHLHDDKLYTDVVNKYMMTGMDMNRMNMSHSDDHGGDDDVDGGSQCGVG
ncbi:MAG: COX aromatic rich motif-containing protein [Candidatus Nomurabacteria bacterium]|nr:MAG: COX aromatic rich motif-containing protein [Candidatus Nomurabacteria bacterium]